MFHKTGLAAVITVFACLPCFGQEWASKMFKTSEHNFGAVAQDAKAEYKFVFENLYLEDIHIANAYTSCGCTSVRIENPLVKTYEQGAIVAHFNTDTFRGQRGATITVIIDRPYPAEVQLHVRGYIRGDVSVEPGSVELGSLDQGRPADWNLSIRHVGSNDWRITEVKTSNPHITAQVEETGRNYGNVSYNLKVHVAADTPAGYLNDHIMLVTNEGRGGQIPVLVEGRIMPGITVSPTQLFMGVLQPGQTVTRQLVIKGKNPFRILGISCDDEAFHFNATADNSSKQLHLVPVTFQAGKKIGKVFDTIRIKTDQGETAPELEAFAVVAEPEVPQTTQASQ